MTLCLLLIVSLTLFILGSPLYVSAKEKNVHTINQYQTTENTSLHLSWDADKNAKSTKNVQKETDSKQDQELQNSEDLVAEIPASRNGNKEIESEVSEEEIEETEGKEEDSETNDSESQEEENNQIDEIDLEEDSIQGDEDKEIESEVSEEEIEETEGKEENSETNDSESQEEENNQIDEIDLEEDSIQGDEDKEIESEVSEEEIEEIEGKEEDSETNDSESQKEENNQIDEIDLEEDSIQDDEDKEIESEVSEEEIEKTEGKEEDSEPKDSDSEKKEKNIVINNMIKANTFTKSDKYFKAAENKVPIYDNRSGSLVKVGELEKGQVYERYNSSTDWHQILFGDYRAYVRKSQTTPADGKEIKNKNNGQYTNQKENTFTTKKDVTVYDNSSGSLVPFAKISKGQTYTVAHDYDGGWIYVLLADRIGYVKTDEVQKNYFTKSDKYFKAAKNKVPIYDKRSGNLVKVGELEKGQSYERIDGTTVWHQILFGDYRAYVKQSQTTPTDGKEIKNKNNGQYTNQKGNTFTTKKDVTVYDNSSGSLAPFATISKGQNYTIAHDYDGGWIYVLLADRIGYVKTNDVQKNYFTKSDKYFKAAENKVPIYDNRSGSLVKVGELEKGQVYERYNSSTDWHQILFGDYRAYVRQSQTTPADGKEIKNKNNGQYTNQKGNTFTTKKDVTVYDNSSGSLKSFAKISKGQNYTIAYDYDGDWIYVLLADRIGYVKTNDVQKNYFTKSDKYFKAAKNKVPIYDNRSGSLVKVGELEKGQSYERIDSTTVWHQILFGNYRAYVRQSQTTPTDGKEIKNKNNGQYSNQKGKTFTTKKDVIVYDNSSGSLVPFATISKNQNYAVAHDYDGDWIYVLLADRVGFVKTSDVSLNYDNESVNVNKTKYNLTLAEALKMQMNAGAQTDSPYAYVSKTYISNNRVTASALNVRGGPSASYKTVGQLSNGAKVTILGEYNGWYQISYNHRQWVNASEEDVLYYLDPTNFTDDDRQQFQFLDLSKTSDALLTELNNYLSGKGTLSNQGQAFKDASKTHGINDVYLLSHAILETGNGSSTLAQGVMYNGVKVYNMYGVGAFDNCAIECGAKKAYEEGWTTPYKAIIGGASFIGNNYVKAGQNTLYKMRWNPEGMDRYGYATHQYATDIGWAQKQVSTMYNLYQALNLRNLQLDIPDYKL